MSYFLFNDFLWIIKTSKMSDSGKQETWSDKAKSVSSVLGAVAWCLLIILIVVYMFRDGGINVNLNSTNKGLLSDYWHQQPAAAPQTVVLQVPATTATAAKQGFSQYSVAR
jgi:ABC-type phosphate transport system permease subunit